MRVVEMLVQAQANGQTGRSGCCHNKRHSSSQPRSGGVKPNSACKSQLYLLETSVGLGILDYSQRFVGEDSQRSRQGQGSELLAWVYHGHLYLQLGQDLSVLREVRVIAMFLCCDMSTICIEITSQTTWTTLPHAHQSECS
jgi:hypothetical protein